MTGSQSIQTRVITATLAAALCVAVVLSGAETGLAHSSPAPPQSPADEPSRLSGIWKLNRDLSTDTSKIAEPAVASGSGDGSGSRSGSAGRYGGFGGGGGRSRTGSNQEQMAQMRALWREITDAPQQVTIVVTASAVMFTDDQGAVRKYTPNSKKESIDLATARIDATTTWDGGVLKQGMAGGPLKASWAYQVTVQGHQLVVTIMTPGAGSPGGQGPTTPITRVYDRAG